LYIYIEPFYSIEDGKTQTMNLHAKWSTAIVRELMDSVGSPSWERWKAEAVRTGLPLIPGSEYEPAAKTTSNPEPRFSLDEWRAKHPRKVRRRPEASLVRGKTNKTGKDVKTGAAQPKRKDSKETKVTSPVQTERVAAAQMLANAEKEKVKQEAEERKVKQEAEERKVKQEAEERKAAKKEARRAKLDAPRLAEEAAERRVALELLAKPRTGAAAVLP
jgi:hypothetical protein